MDPAHGRHGACSLLGAPWRKLRTAHKTARGGFSERQCQLLRSFLNQVTITADVSPYSLDLCAMTRGRHVRCCDGPVIVRVRTAGKQYLLNGREGSLP